MPAECDVYKRVAASTARPERRTDAVASQPCPDEQEDANIRVPIRTMVVGILGLPVQRDQTSRREAYRLYPAWHKPSHSRQDRVSVLGQSGLLCAPRSGSSIEQLTSKTAIRLLHRRITSAHHTQRTATSHACLAWPPPEAYRPGDSGGICVAPVRNV
jgi:hypothetical protein